MRLICFAALLTLLAGPAWAEEFSAFGGVMQDRSNREHSFTWQIEYLERAAQHAAFSLSYLNEGHVPDHHRDGVTAQVWAFAGPFDPRLSLGAGIGPYYFFDTTGELSDGPYLNSHGWGAVASLGAIYRMKGPWLFHLRANWTATRELDTLSTLFGVGYHVGGTAAATGKTFTKSDRKLRNEMTVYIGRTIVNSFGSEPAFASSIEYRRVLLSWVEWTAAWLHEGRNDMIARNGAISQFWVVQSYFDERLSVGVSAGGYYAADRVREQEERDEQTVTGIGTLSVRYLFENPWGIRFSWNRTLTNYNRDTDVLTIGLGYRY